MKDQSKLEKIIDMEIAFLTRFVLAAIGFILCYGIIVWDGY